MANHAHRRKNRPKPRPMTGLWAQLTEEQKARFIKMLAKEIVSLQEACKYRQLNPKLEKAPCTEPGFRGSCCKTVFYKNF